MLVSYFLDSYFVGYAALPCTIAVEAQISTSINRNRRNTLTFLMWFLIKVFAISIIFTGFLNNPDIYNFFKYLARFNAPIWLTYSIYVISRNETQNSQDNPNSVFQAIFQIFIPAAFPILLGPAALKSLQDIYRELNYNKQYFFISMVLFALSASILHILTVALLNYSYRLATFLIKLSSVLASLTVFNALC